MLHSLKYIIVTVSMILVFSDLPMFGQDNERPLSPQLTLVSVDPQNGYSHIFWTPGGSPDVAGYVIYLYVDEQGEAVDTIYDPLAVDYLYTKTFANNYSVDYVVAAIDSSDNTSPLSNPLSTIFLSARLDTCSHSIILDWNEYTSLPLAVQSYNIFVTEGSGMEVGIGTTGSELLHFVYSEFETGNTYCFRVEANIEGGATSSSNLACVETNIIRPPAWINANYSMIDNQNNIELSFTYDSNSEIELFRLERADSPTGPYTFVKDISNSSGTISETAGILGNQAVYFRLSAINNCNTAVITSNITTALPLALTISGNEAEIKWPKYREFKGGLSEYRVYRIMNDQRSYLYSCSEGDTIYREDLSNFIYQNNDDRICYQVEAVELSNPHLINGISTSKTGCLDTPTQVFVPNAFTPDGDLLNDEFGPVLSFTPARYRLFIKTLSGLTIFNTSNHLDKWDGTQGGQMMEPGVYLWFLEIVTPGGKEIIKNGSVTIIFN